MNYTTPAHQLVGHASITPYAINPALYTSLDDIIVGRVEESSHTVAPARRAKGRPRKVDTNTLKPYLQYCSPGYALSSLPHFDDIVTGAVNIDLGDNTRPLSKKAIVAMLRSLDVISTATVQRHMHMTLRQCGERHAQKVAQCLRIITKAAEKLAKAEWSCLNNPHDYRPSYITPCGRESCIICCNSFYQGLEMNPDLVCESIAADLECNYTDQEDYLIDQN